MPARRRRGRSWCSPPSRRRDFAALHPVRSGRRFFQQIRCHRLLLAGSAVDRRRAHAVPAGLRRRRRRRRCRRDRGARTQRGSLRVGGPEVRSFKDLMRFVLATIERRRLLIPIPFALAKLQASLLQWLPKPLLTPDQVALLRSDNVVSEQASAKDARSQRSGSIRSPWKASSRPISGGSASRASSRNRGQRHVTDDRSRSNKPRI